MKQPVVPTPELRRKAERDTILSACTGALGDVTLTDSAVIILFRQNNVFCNLNKVIN